MAPLLGALSPIADLIGDNLRRGAPVPGGRSNADPGGERATVPRSGAVLTAASSITPYCILRAQAASGYKVLLLPTRITGRPWFNSGQTRSTFGSYGWTPN